MNFKVKVGNKSFVLSEKHLDIVSDTWQYKQNNKQFDLLVIETTNSPANLVKFVNYIEGNFK